MNLTDLFNTLILKPLSYPFFQKSMLAVIMIGIVAGIIGCYIVIKGMAFLADALAHAVLPGVAIAYRAQQSLILGAFIMGALSALVIGFLTRGARLKEDTAIGIVFTTMLALGIGIMSTAQQYTADLSHILIGSVLAISETDLAVIGGVGLLVILVIFAFYKELLLNAFDPILARTLRLPGELLRYMLLLLMALTIVISIQAVGVVLIAALLVTPAAAARMLARRLPAMMAISGLIGASAGIIGLLLAWHLKVAPSATIVVTVSLIFLVVFALAPERGLFRTLGNRRGTIAGAATPSKS